MSSKQNDLKARILAGIQGGDWGIGKLLPPVEELTKEYGATVYQLRKALRELAAQGVLRLAQRKGTVVLRTAPVRQVAILPPVESHLYALTMPALCRHLADRAVRVHVAPPGLSLAETEEVLENWHDRLGGQVRLVVMETWIRGGDEMAAGWEIIARLFPDNILCTLEPYNTIPGAGHIIGPNYQEMARQVAEHLWQQGHRTIAVSGGWASREGMDLSSMYFSSEHARHLIEVLGGKCIITDRYAMSTSEAEVRRLFIDEQATAIWAINDYVAHRILGLCLKLGLRVPEDVAIVGRHDTPWSRDLFLPLTSVGVESDALANTIIRVLDGHDGEPGEPATPGKTGNGTTPRSRTLVMPKLTARESTAWRRAG